MTAFVVLMISFMASSITAMRQIQPIREMAMPPAAMRTGISTSA